MAITPVSPEARNMATALADLAARVEAIEVGLRTGQLGNSSLENSGLNAYDGDGNLRYTVGLQEDGAFVGMSINNPNPPPVPSAPVVEPGIASIKVTYEGETEDGVGLPSDWSHSNIYVAPPSGVWEKVGTLLKYPDTFTVAPLEYVEYDVALTNVNYSGKESDKGSSTQATPVQVVGQDVLDGIITETKIAADAVTAAKIAADAVGTGKIQNNAVDLSKLADGSVDATKLIDGAVETAKIAAGAVTTNELGANSVVAGKIAANAIESSHITAGAVIAGKLAVDSVQAGNIVAAAVTASKIDTLAVTTDKLAANAVTAGKIDAGAVTAAKLQADLVVASRIIAGNPTGARTEIHPTAGLQAYKTDGTSRTFWIDAATGSAFLAGEITTDLGTGPRIRINPGGSTPDEVRFYQTSTVYAYINAEAGAGGTAAIVMRGSPSGRGQVGVYGAEAYTGWFTGSETTARAAVSCQSTLTNLWGGNVNFWADKRYSSGVINMYVLDSSGDQYDDSVLRFYRRNSGGAQLMAINNNSGILFADDAIGITTGSDTTNGPIVASAYNPPSSRRVKQNERNPDLKRNKDVNKFSDILKVAKSRQWEYVSHPGEQHWGPMAEDLEIVHPGLVKMIGEQVVTDIRDLIGVLWAINEELVDRIEVLEASKGKK